MRILIALLILLPVQALAACPAGTQAIQSCTMGGGKKVLDVCLAGDTLGYSYGKVGRSPDLVLRAHVRNANYVPWNGIGRALYEEVRFYNKDVTYIVWGAVDRLTSGNPVTGGVVVEQNGKTLARLECDPNRASYGFEQVYQQMEALGQCWDHTARSWSSCN